MAADAVLGIVNGGVKRAGWLPLLHQHRAYLTAVPQVALVTELVAAQAGRSWPRAAKNAADSHHLPAGSQKQPLLMSICDACNQRYTLATIASHLHLVCRHK